MTYKERTFDYEFFLPAISGFDDKDQIFTGTVVGVFPWETAAKVVRRHSDLLCPTMQEISCDTVELTTHDRGVSQIVGMLISNHKEIVPESGADQTPKLMGVVVLTDPSKVTRTED